MPPTDISRWHKKSTDSDRRASDWRAVGLAGLRTNRPEPLRHCISSHRDQKLSFLYEINSGVRTAYNHHICFLDIVYLSSIFAGCTLIFQLVVCATNMPHQVRTEVCNEVAVLTLIIFLAVDFSINDCASYGENKHDHFKTENKNSFHQRKEYVFPRITICEWMLNYGLFCTKCVDGHVTFNS